MKRTLAALFGIVILITSSISFAGDCGDVNNSGVVDALDVTYMINYIYKGGPPPNPLPSADVNNSGNINVLDITYLINYLYKHGPKPSGETVTDIDGNIYMVIKIGDQRWMAENLKVTHYRNGDSIPKVVDNAAWAALASGAYCEYDNDINKVVIYGRYYNGFAITDSRNITPAGWHIPADAEWKQLEMFLGMSQLEADAT